MRCSPLFTSRLDVFPLSSFTTRLLEVFVQIPAVTLPSATRMLYFIFCILELRYSDGSAATCDQRDRKSVV